jgi:hypothetical protein
MAHKRTRARKGGRELFLAFLAKNKLRPVDAAKGLGVSKASISLLLRDERPMNPSGRMRELIAVWTGGAVPGESWGALTDRRKVKRDVEPFRPGSAA